MSDEDRYNHLVELCQELLASDKRGQEIPFAGALKKIKREVEGSSPDMTPGPEDVGRWVEVRDSNEDRWEGPFLLTKVILTATPYYGVLDLRWKQARIVPGPIRGTLQEHDGSDTKPEGLADDDEVLLEFSSFKAIRSASFSSWDRVRRYQKLELK